LGARETIRRAGWGICTTRPVSSLTRIDEIACCISGRDEDLEESRNDAGDGYAGVQTASTINAHAKAFSV
jgi:hypothetical protein